MGYFQVGIAMWDISRQLLAGGYCHVGYFQVGIAMWGISRWVLPCGIFPGRYCQVGFCRWVGGFDNRRESLFTATGQQEDFPQVCIYM